VPNATSYVVASADPIHVNEVDIGTAVAALAGDGPLGADGPAFATAGTMTPITKATAIARMVRVR
jgi:hypothetical protein